MPLPQCPIACYHILPSFPGCGMCNYQDVSMANIIGKQSGTKALSLKTHIHGLKLPHSSFSQSGPDIVLILELCGLL